MFRIALAVLALRVVDDRFLGPEPGTSATDHLVSGLVPLALLGLVAWLAPRLPRCTWGARGRAGRPRPRRRDRRRLLHPRARAGNRRRHGLARARGRRGADRR